MATRLIFSALALVSAVAHAEPGPWMRKPEPNELVVAAFHHANCPMTQDQVMEVAEGLLVRSRIKLIKWTTETPSSMMPWLVIDTSCLEKGSVAIAVNFVGQHPVTGTRFRHGLVPYGVFGNIGDRDVAQFNDMLRDSLEYALTDYLKTNFNL